MSLKHAITWFVYVCTNIVNVNITWQQTYRGLIWRFWRVCLHKSSCRQFFTGLVQYITGQNDDHSDSGPPELDFSCMCVTHIVKRLGHSQKPRIGSRKWHVPTKSRCERDSLAQPIMPYQGLTLTSPCLNEWCHFLTYCPVVRLRV